MFEAREVALQVAAEIKEPMERIRKQRASMGDQIERAVMSSILNIGEASRRIGKDRANRYRYASGSLAETRDALALAVAWKWIAAEDVAAVQALIDRVLAMLWRLENPKKRRSS
jgi:four helix bundle protein